VSQHFAIGLFEAGYAGELISVIPPKATLSPNSKMAASSLGKAPGKRYDNGTWGGYNWRKHVSTQADINQWIQDGANFGLRAGHYPGLDIDSLNPTIVEKVKELAFEILGPAPVRVGKAPKSLLMYRTAEPFTRMQIMLVSDDTQHLIELLADGQQYLVAGIHASTLRPYTWDQTPPKPADLTAITAEKVNTLFLAIKAYYEKMGFTVKRNGNGIKQERTVAADQSALRAPDLDALRLAVSAIPNNEAFKERDDWLKMGYAIRAACGDDLEEGLDIFAEWCERWTGGVNEPEYVSQNWRRMDPGARGYSIGWPWLAEKARGFGYNDAQDDFTADPNAVPPGPAGLVIPSPGPMRLSDSWLADEVVDGIGDRLRYVAERGRWYVWDGSYWVPDATEAARYAASQSLRAISIRETANAQGAAAIRDGRNMESANTLSRVLSLVRSDPAIAVKVDSLDADPWLLNTPGGVLNLKDGNVTPGLPEQLHTKQTRVAPLKMGDAPVWSRFLIETTGGDMALVGYLQRLAGYCLTGVTVEQVLTFIWGPGGNGKSVFLNAVSEILGDYGTVSTMDVCTASNMERHTTDIADMMGSRLVTASETQIGRRWDEQRLKMLSGGERVKARFMRQDNIMYRPTFKIIFSGNHQPHIRGLDEAMRRRIHMVPFTQKPAIRDSLLGDKLRLEYPAILDWMLLGCLKWQQEGLNPPESVLAQTEEYFESEDIIGQWIADYCDIGHECKAYTTDLFQSWREWCGENGERNVGRMRDLLSALEAKKFTRHRDSIGGRRNYLAGIAVNKAASMDMEVGP